MRAVAAARSVLQVIIFCSVWSSNGRAGGGRLWDPKNVVKSSPVAKMAQVVANKSRREEIRLLNPFPVTFRVLPSLHGSAQFQPKVRPRCGEETGRITVLKAILVSSIKVKAACRTVPQIAKCVDVVRINI
jgi:hypothetical protein